MKYQLIDYDVWGNEEDRFWVNQSFFTEKFIDLDDVSLHDDDKFLQALKDEGILKDHVTWDDLQVDGEPDYTLYFTDVERGHPEFELRKVE